MTDTFNPDDMRIRISDNLTIIAEMFLRLRAAAINHASDPDIPGGDATVLLGPGADIEAWGYVQMSAIFGRLKLGDRWSTERDRKKELEAIEAEGLEPPLSFLASWADIVRDARGQKPSNRRAAIGHEIKYLRSALDWMLATNDEGEPWFVQVEEFASGLSKIRAAMENVLHDGFRPERAAPCLHCRRPLERDHDRHHGFLDSYTCRSCWRKYDKREYDYAVGVTYLHHSPVLTAAQIEERTNLKASRVRVWGSRYPELKRGKNPEGLWVYDVDGILAKLADIDGTDAA